jgi:hypothetical protein
MYQSGAIFTSCEPKYGNIVITATYSSDGKIFGEIEKTVGPNTFFTLNEESSLDLSSDIVVSIAKQIVHFEKKLNLFNPVSEEKLNPFNPVLDDWYIFKGHKLIRLQRR